MTKILIKRGQQADLGNLTLAEGELALAYNTEKTKAEIYAGNINGEKILLNPTGNTMKPATIIIGTSTAGHTANNVDYLCDGTADQAEINAAISALPESGGKIVILEGTYNLSNGINILKSNITIEGMGQSTVLSRKFNGNTIYINNQSNCILCNFAINGNKDTYTQTNSTEIYVFNMVSGKEHIINNIWISNTAGKGIYLRSLINHCKVSNVHIEDAEIGIFFDGTICNYIAGNTILNCLKGIEIDWSSSNNIVEGNTVYSDGRAASRGIIIGNAGTPVNNIIINNYVRNHETNIEIRGSYNIIANNVTKQDLDGQRSIHIGSSGQQNLVMGNAIFFTNYLNDGGTTNTFSNNKF